MRRRRVGLVCLLALFSAHVLAALRRLKVTEGGRYPQYENGKLNKNVIKGEKLRETWFDPRYGVSYFIKEQDTYGIQTYTPPTNGRGQDWGLVLTDAAAGFTLPGASQ